MFSVFTKLCIESPGRIYFLFQVCPLKHFSILHHQPLQSPGDSILLLVFTIFFRILHVKWYIVFVFLCLNYLTFICSSFIHVVANRRMPFFAWVNNTPVCVCVCVCVTFSCLITDGYLGIFKFLAIVNISAINVGVHISLQYPVFISFSYIPRSGIADMIDLFLIFWEISHMFSIVVKLTYIPTNSVQGFFSPHPHKHLPCLLGDGHNRWEVVSPCGFDFHYSGN